MPQKIKIKSKPLPVKRIYEVADSLDKDAGYKIGSALQKFREMDETDKKGKDWLGRNPQEARKAANELWDSGEVDRANAARYRSIANEAIKKAKQKKK